MRIVVVGHVINDVLRTVQGNETHTLGGIYYTLVFLSVLLPEQYEIIPVTGVGEDIAEKFITFIKKSSNISDEGIQILKQPNNRVLLEYFSESDRNETSLYPLPAVNKNLLEKLLKNCDLLVINMISGWELSGKDLLQIRDHYRGLIAIDLHSYLLGRDTNGRRFYRKPDDSETWLESGNFIQMNEAEFNILNSDNLEPEQFYRQYCFSKRNLINLTRGKKGSLTIYSEGNLITTISHNPGIKSDSFDPTGCGDAFLAGFVAGIINQRNLDSALSLANYAAGINGLFTGAPDPEELKEKMKAFNTL